jgi:aminoglycoside phosphotransferase (APT) family kinase protein
MQKRTLTTPEVEAFLQAHHRAQVRNVEALHGGFWSAAYAYRLDDRELVVRFGASRDGYDMDQAAMAFDGPGLPVPEVIHVGEALGGAFAISVRHHGRFLEDVEPSEAAAVGPAVERLLAALRSHVVPPSAPPDWFGSVDPSPATWRSWLEGGLTDQPTWPNHGWRARLAEHADADRLYRACEARLAELRDACPERRDLVHSDLLHQNVLLNDAGDAVTAVFSWKCSMYGDFLWDVAWCSLWSPWHPGIAALDLFGRTLTAPDLRPADLEDADVRHAAYMLQIGAHHLGWNAWTGDEATLREVMARTEEVLEMAPT